MVPVVVAVNSLCSGMLIPNSHRSFRRDQTVLLRRNERCEFGIGHELSKLSK